MMSSSSSSPPPEELPQEQQDRRSPSSTTTATTPPTPIECSALCGNNATGMLHFKVRIRATDAEATAMPLPLCYSCRERIDPDHKWVFVPFE